MKNIWESVKRGLGINPAEAGECGAELAMAIVYNVYKLHVLKSSAFLGSSECVTASIKIQFLL